jgi:hypothetical protein
MSKWDKQLDKLVSGKQINVTLAEYRWLEIHDYKVDAIQASNKGYYVIIRK